MWRVDEYGPDGKLVRQWPTRYETQESADRWIRQQHMGEQVPDGHRLTSVEDESARNPWTIPVMYMVAIAVVIILVSTWCLFGRVNH